MLNGIARNRTILISKWCIYVKLNCLKYNYLCMLNCIARNRTVFDIETVLTLNLTARNITVFTFNCVKTKTILIIN